MPRVLTPALVDRVVESGQIEAVIEVLDVRNGELLLTTDPLNVGESRMKVVSGNLTTDEARAVVGTGTAELLVDSETAEAVLPLVQGASLSPTAPAQVHTKFRAAGDTEVTDYGVYEVDTIRTRDSSDGVVMTVEVSDSSRRVERARFWKPVTINKNTPYATAFSTLLNAVLLPDVDLDVAPTTAKTGMLAFEAQDDRLAAVNSMAAAIGFRIDWNADGRGNVDIYPDTDSQDEPVWTFVSGGNARVTSLDRGLTDERSYNGVIAFGESPGSDRPPVRAEFWDNDPSSPTYFDPLNPEASVYGPVPFFYVSEFITTTTQAVEAARARLPKVLGLVEELTIEALPNPGIVPGDPILVERPETGVTGVFIVGSVNLPLTGRQGRMTVVCRERRVFL